MYNRSFPASAVEEYRSLQLNEYTATAAFTVTVWDALITLKDEVTYIWPKPHTSYIKWLYLFGKYFTLVSQIGFFWFQVNVVLHDRVPEHACSIYRGLEAAQVELLLLIFDFVLYIRIYALYGQKTFAVVLGACAVVLECTTAVLGAVFTFPGMTYASDCAVINFPEAVLLVAVGALVSQTTLLWLAYRRRRAVLPADRRRTSLASITIRDGVIGFVCIVTIFVTFVICQLSDSSDSYLAVYWLPVFISIATSRVIMNIQQASPPQASEYELSTQIFDDSEMQSRSSSTPSDS